jgi:hypothetical protein
VTTVEEIAKPAESPAGAPQWTETTRLMCAAAYLDATFAQEVIEEIVEEPFRAVQVPAGVDLVPVVKHCLAAQRQKLVRDLILLALFVVFVVLTFKSRSLAPLLVGYLLGWLTITADLLISTFSIATGRLTARNFDPEQAPAMSDRTADERVADLARRQDGNLVVYSGFSPFASAGIDLKGWSFVIDLRKAAERFGERREPVPFDPKEIYDAVTDSVERLDINGLSVHDRVYVNGTDIREDRTLLPDERGRPAASVDDERIEAFLRTPTHQVRHYRCFRVVDWRGELVVSLFLRFAVNDQRMFVEFSPFVLGPVLPEYRRIDSIEDESTARQVLGIAARSALSTFGLGIRSFGTAVRPFTRMRRQTQRERQVRHDYFYDYGARPTPLDRARSIMYSRYFQKLDKEMHTKLLERAMLDAITEFLDGHGIDTGELVQRRDTIINTGVWMQGGTMKAHNVGGSNSTFLERFRSGGTRGTGEGGAA